MGISHNNACVQSVPDYARLRHLPPEICLPNGPPQALVGWRRMVQTAFQMPYLPAYGGMVSQSTAFPLSSKNVPTHSHCTTRQLIHNQSSGALQVRSLRSTHVRIIYYNVSEVKLIFANFFINRKL